MNFSKIAFMGSQPKDSTRIESILPFSQISKYKKFLPQDYERKYEGLYDLGLLHEYKTTQEINFNQVGYVQVSKLYFKASIKNIETRPDLFLSHLQYSGLNFFVPVTNYYSFSTEYPSLKYYNGLYAFDFSYFLTDKKIRIRALLTQAIPKMLVYAFVFGIILGSAWKQKKISLLNSFVIITIGYVFCISTVLEYGENMRFRYEVEPIFILLLAQAVERFLSLNKNKKSSQ